MCGGKEEKLCKINLIKFLKVLELEDFEYTEEYIRNKITVKLESKLSETKITSVLLNDDITKTKSTEIKLL
jgi:hypothetical protein